MRHSIPHHRRSTLQAFTLVELLVVVAIISLLVAMLLPSLVRAKSLSKQAACLAHIRQVGVATFLMASDNNGWLNVTNRPYGPNGIDAWNVGYWIDAITNYGVAQLVAYQGKGCPSRSSKDTWYPFGANNMFVGWGYAPMHSLNEVVHKSRVFLLGECYFWYPSSGTHFDYTVGSQITGPLGGILNVNYVDLRHEGRGLNFIFCDGHGEFLTTKGIVINPQDCLSPWWHGGYAQRWFPGNVWDSGQFWGE
jgi:prepilin-type N-terminal cleavage/methylation domain-containing protein/prepilin-type processing-associated H-X9-DG protein